MEKHDLRLKRKTQACLSLHSFLQHHLVAVTVIIRISITEVEDSGCCGARAAVVTTPTESVNTVDVRLGEVRETEAGVRVE